MLKTEKRKLRNKPRKLYYRHREKVDGIRFSRLRLHDTRRTFRRAEKINWTCSLHGIVQCFRCAQMGPTNRLNFNPCE